jgi:predicted ArsR family transcriptional regulator
VNTPGELLSLIRAGTAVTRADLARHTGLARSTVAQRVDALLASGLVLEAGGTPSTGGRPATMLAFNHEAGVVLVADLGATHARVAVTDLAGAPLAERAGDLDIALGPDEVLTWVSARFDELLQ